MRNIASLTAALLIVACSSSNDGGAPQTGTSACSAAGQKQFVLERMNDVYFWNELLPRDVDLTSFASAEDLLAYLTSFAPLDGFSYIDSASADAQFFGAGQYEGYGFSSRIDGPDDLRLTRVFASSPAADAGFARGHRVLELDGRAIRDIIATNSLDAIFAQTSVDFRMRRPDGSEFTSRVTKGLVTIDPVPQSRLIPRTDGTSVGYLELATFISTADAQLEEVFATFRQANVSDVIIDLRYNSGGLVSTTELLGDFLGGAIAENLVFSRTLFNTNNSAFNRTRFFQRMFHSTNTSRLVVIAGNRTASASELVTNSMMPHVDVAVVGDATFGKPVGQLGIEFCDKILRPTAFETVNADNGGQYFDGIPADCPAADNLATAVGAGDDPNLVAALNLLETGACPSPVILDNGASKPRPGAVSPLRGPPWREFADAW